MGDWSITHLDDVDDFLGDHPGEMKMITYPAGAEQVALTWRTLPKGAGARGPSGPRRKAAGGLFFILPGTLTFRLEDEVIEVPAGSTVRVPPHVARSVHNDHD